MVNNPRELSACLPFDVDYQTLISEEERQMLLEGKPVEKEGYEPRFGKNIVAAIIPLLDENRLEGIIYTYIPVDSITEYHPRICCEMDDCCYFIFNDCYCINDEVAEKINSSDSRNGSRGTTSVKRGLFNKSACY